MLLAARNVASLRLGARLSAQLIRPAGCVDHGQVRRGNSTSASGSTEQAPSSFSHERMESDKRYQSNAEIPESLLKAEATSENEFSIRGKFREGKAAYLDMSATTPLDPRVFDAMAPYMVRTTLKVISFIFYVVHAFLI